MDADKGPGPDANKHVDKQTAAPQPFRPRGPTAARSDSMVSLALAVAGAVIVGLVFYEINARTSDINGVRPTLAHSPSTMYR